MSGTISSTPADLFTSSVESDRRYKTQPLTLSQDRFNKGKSYRTDYVIDIANNTGPLVLKFDFLADVDLTLSQVNLVSGGVLFQVFNESQVTEDSPFTVSENVVFPRNTRLPSDPMLNVYSGGEITTSGRENTNVYVVTSGSGNNTQAAISSDSMTRGLSAGANYVVFTQIGNSDMLGTFKIEYEIVE